ncbi:MAG: hypothetical protein II169_00945 [Lachnospiraceae bacterium]|nr:hypothetical protein [Lachnospiraceae bacterium]
MEIIDEKIKEEFRKSELPLPDGFDQMIKEKIAEGIEKSKGQKIIVIPRRTKRLIASFALVCVVISVIGISGKANVNHLKNRLQSLSEEEKEEMVENADEATVPAAIFTRDFTDSERDRMQTLRIKYESEGLYPEKELLVIDSEEDVDAETICFYPKLCKYYLPDRELTDEELLEYIDYSYKENYALQERTDKNDEELNIEVCSDEELKSMAIDKIESCFGVSEEDLTVSVRLHSFCGGIDGGYERTADVNLYDVKNKDSYQVEIEAVSGTILGVYKNNGIMGPYYKEKHSANTVEYDEQECRDKYEQFKTVAESYGEGERIKDGCCYVFVRGNTMIDDIVMFLYKTENGNYIDVDYCLDDYEVECIEESSESEFNSILEWWNEDAAKEGYEIKKIDM